MEPANRNTSVKTGSPKPGSSFNDSLFVLLPGVVFFNPDSLQLEKIKQVTGAGIFQSTMHDYFYQIQYARFYVMEHWPEVRITDVEKVRYLVFRKIDGGLSIIDLDNEDPCGMYVFDRVQDPLLIDMTNVNTQVSGYFSGWSSGEHE